MNETHDPALRSWVESANAADAGFPIQSLPFGVFVRKSIDGPGSAGVAIGECIVDVAECVDEGLLTPSPAAIACRNTTLNELMSLDEAELSRFRAEVSSLLSADGEKTARARAAEERILVGMTEAEMRLPVNIGDYSDFYASIQHATNVGSMFRPDNPLLPNYKYVPIGYHGRASSIVESGQEIRRPLGQTKAADAEEPSFGPSRMLDYESELGFFVRRGNALGQPVPLDHAAAHIFGFCLVNDWSARDIQAWEYQPLGPFLAKNFATSISPWVITSEAIEPYRIPAASRPDGDPAPLDYLRSSVDAERGGIAASLEVWLATSRMRRDGVEPVRISRTSFSSMYWTVGQMLAHHSSNGCNLRPGDLLASGTVSGGGDDERGCLLELTSRGARPLSLSGGETRKFLEDGDEVIMKGFLEASGRPRLSLGECRGTILPAVSR